MHNQIIKCGYIGKSAGYYYYIQNVILQKTGWTEVTFSYNEKKYKYTNMNKEMKFEMITNNNYDIILMVDGNYIITTKTLFEVELNILAEPTDNFYRFEEGLIVDH